jgi:hypothetical protein
MWEPYLATGLISVAVGIAFFPRRRYRFWWQWLNDQRQDVSLSLIAFCVINAASAIGLYVLADIANVGTDARPVGRVFAAVVATQAVLRGRAPRYGQTSSAQATLISRCSAWFMDDLDHRSATAVARYCQRLHGEKATDLAWYLHRAFTVPDDALTKTVKRNEEQRIKQARLGGVDDPERELRSVCQEVILRSHASLSAAERHRFFGE